MVIANRIYLVGQSALFTAGDLVHIYDPDRYAIPFDALDEGMFLGGYVVDSVDYRTGHPIPGTWEFDSLPVSGVVLGAGIQPFAVQGSPRAGKKVWGFNRTTVTTVPGNTYIGTIHSPHRDNLWNIDCSWGVLFANT